MTSQSNEVINSYSSDEGTLQGVYLKINPGKDHLEAPLV